MSCKCFNCARLASCPKASKSITKCRLYIEMKMTVPQMAKILKCSKDQILELKHSDGGIRYLVKRLAAKGVNVRVEKNDKGVFVWRKEPFQRDRQVELSQLGLYIALLAQSSQQQNYTGAI